MSKKNSDIDSAIVKAQHRLSLSLKELTDNLNLLHKLLVSYENQQSHYKKKPYDKKTSKSIEQEHQLIH